MKSKIALIALALFAGQASAEWDMIGWTDISQVYIDRSTIRKQNRYTLVWILTNYAKPEKTLVGSKSFSSTKSITVAKCGEFEIATKSATYYSEALGNGLVVDSVRAEFYELTFKDVIPGSIGESEYNIICGIE